MSLTHEERAAVGGADAIEGRAAQEIGGFDSARHPGLGDRNEADFLRPQGTRQAIDRPMTFQPAEFRLRSGF